MFFSHIKVSLFPFLSLKSIKHIQVRKGGGGERGKEKEKENRSKETT